MCATALALQVLTIGYHQATTRFDLFPFNGIRNYTGEERRREVIENGLVMGLPLGLTLVRMDSTRAAAALIWSAIAAGAFFTWWWPYLTGREVFRLPNETWPEMYERIFARTIMVLPPTGDRNRPTPNLEHMILHTLILATTLAVWGCALWGS